MNDVLFSYTTSFEASEVQFKNICAEIEKNVKGVEKGALLIDVDGSAIQKYVVGSKTITIQNDYEVDAVYIDSEIDLTDIITISQ